MKLRQIRNAIVSGLSAYLGIPVVLSNQINPELKYPFVIYSVTAPYIPEDGLGEYSSTGDGKEQTIETRREQPTCTMSFTVCSTDRDVDGESILGEDEALELAEKALGWFLHSGYWHISGRGIAVVDAGNIQERSVLQVDEEARRYGFDILIRYVREDSREAGIIKSVAVKKGDYK